MKVKLSRPSSWKCIFEIEVPHAEVSAVYNGKMATYQKKLSLPGFRQGKVPLPLIKNRFGKGIFAETVDDLIQKDFESACREHSVTPVSKGSISALSGEEGTDVSFTIETEVDPAIDIKGYDKLKIKVSQKNIKADDIDRAIMEARERNAQFKDCNRPSQKGDFAAIVYEKVVIDGIERKDFKNPTYPIELGEGKLKDFDKGLIGRVDGETAEIPVKFPKDFSEEQLAGKQGMFTVKINKVSEKVLPQLDEEFLKKLGDFKTVEELRERVRADLENQEKERVKNEAYNDAIDFLIRENPFEVPPSRIESYIDHILEEMSRYRRVGEPMPKREEVAEKYRESAIRAIKRFRIIDFIAKQEKIKATQEEVDKEIEKIAARYDQPFEKVKQTFRQNGTTNRIREDIREQKTLDFLIREFSPKIED